MEKDVSTKAPAKKTVSSADPAKKEEKKPATKAPAKPNADSKEHKGVAEKPKTKATSTTTSKPKPKPTTEAKTKVKAETTKKEVIVKPKAKPKPKPKAEPETKEKKTTEADDDTGSKANADADVDVDADAEEKEKDTDDQDVEMESKQEKSSKPKSEAKPKPNKEKAKADTKQTTLAFEKKAVAKRKLEETVSAPTSTVETKELSAAPSNKDKGTDTKSTLKKPVVAKPDEKKKEAAETKEKKPSIADTKEKKKEVADQPSASSSSSSSDAEPAIAVKKQKIQADTAVPTKTVPEAPVPQVDSSSDHDSFLMECGRVARSAAEAYSAREDDADAGAKQPIGLRTVRKLLNLMKLSFALQRTVQQQKKYVPHTMQLMDMGCNHLQNLSTYIQCRVGRLFGFDCSKKALIEADRRVADATRALGKKEDAKTEEKRYFARFLQLKPGVEPYRVPDTRLYQCEIGRNEWTLHQPNDPTHGSMDAIHFFLSLHYMATSPLALSSLAEECHQYLRKTPGPSGVRPYICILVPNEDALALRKKVSVTDHFTADKFTDDRYHFTKYEYSQPGLVKNVEEYIVPLDRLDQAFQVHGFTRRSYTATQFMDAFDPPPFPDVETPKEMMQTERSRAWNKLLHDQFQGLKSEDAKHAARRALEHLNFYRFVIYDRE